ncbi:membrane integrity-associated transporter subunit PqiC [Sulfitobacter sp. CW3]|uniref:PqiC family protein n=1 Tax=Sulfitobacter sp. CW3 TaxID=2861965 RepID=UPI001C5F5A09|nr:ABC-type transport auxiliary lipoprotein family protein [Sulfitobacter sp. CW3]MBW4962431.1 PqiC family protein [Sulfitobacter sp. CW3]
MNVVKTIATLGLLLTVVACGSADRYAVTLPPITETVRIAFRSVEVRDVSLPSYAAADEIHIRQNDGTLVSSTDTLWADAPERAVALEISESLSRLTGRPIASEPWPFEAYPDARLELRFTELLATETGQFRAAGQYFVAVSGGGRERSGLFDQSVQFDPKSGPAGIASARGQLIFKLAEFIAKEGLK